MYPSNVWASPFQRAYGARGTGGQFIITVIPSRNLVLVHKTDIDADPKANLADWPTITSMVLATACPASPVRRSDTLEAVPFRLGLKDRAATSRTS